MKIYYDHKPRKDGKYTVTFAFDNGKRIKKGLNASDYENLPEKYPNAGFKKR